MHILASINSAIQLCERELFVLRASESDVPGEMRIEDIGDMIMAEMKKVFTPSDEIEHTLRVLMWNGRLVLRIPEAGRRRPDAVSEFLIRFIVQYAFPESIGCLSNEQQCRIVWLIKRAIFMKQFRYHEKRRQCGVNIDLDPLYETYMERERDEVFILEASPAKSQPDIDIGFCHGRNEGLIQRFEVMIGSNSVPAECDLGSDINQFAEQLREHFNTDKDYCATNRLIEFLIRQCVGEVFAEHLGCKGKFTDPLMFLLAGILISHAQGRRDFLNYLVECRFDCRNRSIYGI